MLKTGLIIDIGNLYYSIRSKFGDKRLMVLDYCKHLEDQGHLLNYKIAYSHQKSNEALSFINLLRNNQFECHFGNTSWAIAMALRAADILPNIDCLVLGTNDPEYGRILGYAKDKGKIAKCLACDIPPFFRQFSQCTEITNDLLLPKDVTLKNQELAEKVDSKVTVEAI